MRRYECTTSGADGHQLKALCGKGEIMGEELPVIYLARHGETAWSLTGQHTGLTDLPLTERGERNARRLGERLKGITFAKVFTSPLQRAPSGHANWPVSAVVAEIDPDLVEWNYGEYEGLRHRRDPARSSGLAALSRRLSRRRIAGSGRRRGQTV